MSPKKMMKKIGNTCPRFSQFTRVRSKACTRGAIEIPFLTASVTNALPFVPSVTLGMLISTILNATRPDITGEHVIPNRRMTSLIAKKDLDVLKFTTH